MPEINYKKLKRYLDQLRTASDAKIAPVYLIHGEEMLVKSVFNELLDFLVPAASRSLNYEPVDGATENIRDVIERINTFSLLPGVKVIAVRDSKIFYTRQDKAKLLENAKNNYDNNDLRKAATDFLSLLGHLNLSFDDVDNSNRSKALGMASEHLSDDAWLDDIIEYCREHHLNIPAPEDDCAVLQNAVEKGFPKNNHLIITTDFIDKRRGLFKTIAQTGLIIDCSVPRGERRADKMAQEDVLLEKMSTLLKASGKQMDKAAYAAMYDMTGFDLRTFSNNLEKLIAYVGDHHTITVDDVESVLERTKKDPIFDLTNAISDRSIESSLFYLDSILTAGFHPLQVLSAITNQIRKLLLVKDFVESPSGSNWYAGCPYNRFQNNVIPEIVSHDKDLLTQIDRWEHTISNEDNSEKKRKTKKGKKKAVTDLLIARNPKNAYPVYQMFLKSERFTKDDLIDALELLNQTDTQLKSSGQNPKLVLEKALLGICQAKPSFVSPM
jgi:DNA polymerase-3 subunit delta